MRLVPHKVFVALRADSCPPAFLHEVIDVSLKLAAKIPIYDCPLSINSLLTPREIKVRHHPVDKFDACARVLSNYFRRLIVKQAPGFNKLVNWYCLPLYFKDVTMPSWLFCCFQNWRVSLIDS